MFETKHHLCLTDDDRSALRQIVRSRSSPAAIALRAAIILQLADGHSVRHVASSQGVSVETVIKWRRRFCREGIAGLYDRRRTGRKRKISAGTVRGIIAAGKCDDGSVSSRSVAATFGVGKTTVQNIWREHGMRPHLRGKPGLLAIPNVAGRYWDVVGIYVDPPEHCIAFCSQPYEERQHTALPKPTGKHRFMRRERVRCRSVGIGLLVQLKALLSRVDSHTDGRRRAPRWLAFLRRVNRSAPRGYEIHLVLTERPVQGHAAIREWMGKRPRIHSHIVPDSGAWLGLLNSFLQSVGVDAFYRGGLLALVDLPYRILQAISARVGPLRRYVWLASRYGVTQHRDSANNRLRELVRSQRR